jgi:hypothetical protein
MVFGDQINQSMGLSISPLSGFFSTWYLILEGTRAMNF